ncbi:hypothetical protein EIP91_004673 [Steccherinum ochraceum]|uniref:DUF2415 domain-containing protein n=1 Tax=Steccherinum ochraceum TaxID=92696 RepID=A0A4R0REJ5_9APHY|nr:hypothetical protein EIP91_004673 [Steccherinum ochraceum]
MARGIPNLLSSSSPCGTAAADVSIGHVQLRDVLICPHEQGVVCYPQEKTLVEHDLATTEVDRLTNLAFLPNSLSYLNIPDSNDTLLAAGGPEAELHLSLYAPPSHTLSPLLDAEGPNPTTPRGFGRQRWRSEVLLDPPASINNSVHLTSLNLGGSHESSAEPRLVISNNDKTVKFYDVALRTRGSAIESTINYRLSGESGATQRLSLIGQLKLDVPVNHSSISPDGRTLLSVGDSPEIFLHRITGGSRISFTPICTLSLSNYINTPSYLFNPNAYANSAVAASFSTAFSANGSKFAVASQEGVVVVWDVRSTKPLKVIQTDKSRRSERGSGNGAASGWIVDGPWDWSRGMGNAPGWGVRSVKFSPNAAGREVMTFTEHTSLVHVIDARTFETEEIVRVPNFGSESSGPSRPRSRSSSPPIRVTSASPPRFSPPVPPPPRILMFSGAVEDAFRIPISEPSSRRRRLARRIRGTRDDLTSPATDDDADVDGIVVIPPLGDSEVENDVRRLLGRRTSHARTRSLQTATFSAQEDLLEDEQNREDDMDVDDYEADCLSSHTTSRASSPAIQSAPSSSTNLHAQVAHPASTTVRLPMPTHIADHPLRLSRPGLQRSWREYSDPYIRRSTSRRHRRTEDEESTLANASASGGDAEQDLAGLCFDPSGEHIYVAATRGVSTWKVRGAEKSWWHESAWA